MREMSRAARRAAALRVPGRGALAGAFLLAAWAAGCVPSYEEKKGRPLDDLTLQNLVSWPADKDYLEAPGAGRPPDGEKSRDARRKVSRDAAVMDAEKNLIAQLEKMVPRGRVRGILEKAQVAGLEWTYDDGCKLTLRVPKDAVVGEKPPE